MHTASSFRRAKVWDDDPLFVKNLCGYLKTFGLLATGGSESDPLDCLPTKRRFDDYDIFIFDVIDQRHGEEVIGLELARLTRLKRPDTLIVLISAHAPELEQRYNTSFVNFGREAGANLVLPKSELSEHGDTEHLARQLWTAYAQRLVDRVVARNPLLARRSILAGVKEVLGKYIQYVDDGAVLSSSTTLLVPSHPLNPNATNCLAFDRERDELLEKYAGQYVAYADGFRLAIAPEENAAYAKARSQAAEAIIMVEQIVPASHKPTVRLRSPRMVVKNRG